MQFTVSRCKPPDCSRGIGDLPVIVRRFFERFPLLAVVVEDDKIDVFVFDKTKEFAGTGTELLLIVVQR